MHSVLLHIYKVEIVVSITSSFSADFGLIWKSTEGAKFS